MTYTILVKGVVQGVGFRPFIYRTALDLGLCGYVQNSAHGVVIKIDCAKADLDKMIEIIRSSPPLQSSISDLTFAETEPEKFSCFEIRASEKGGEIRADISPDLAVCNDCLNEMNDPQDRRFRYPFINCTNCGPRFSIIESIPYDRPNTTMKSFEMCELCRKEYLDPMNRRFHAQPIACPDCGPHIEFWDKNVISSGDKALLAAVSQIKAGSVIALKGLGGFQLIVDASNEDAVKELRRRKHRDDKPFAVMFQSVGAIEKVCKLSDDEKELLNSSVSPIVLVRKNDDGQINSDICASVAPSNPYLGVMLPYTPLHHLIMHELKYPIVATSGNLTDESMAYDEYDALERFTGIADSYLVHNRPIQRPVDDSIVRVVDGRKMILRLARGYAPMSFKIPRQFQRDHNYLAVGAHLKNSVAIKKNDSIIISQHIGDLGSAQTNSTFRATIDDIQELYELNSPEMICDKHPDYISTQTAHESDPVHEVQHHVAHIASCLLEHNVQNRALGISWDGTGYGLDGTSWGGEFFIVENGEFEHFATLRKFPLPGGDRAAREPRRTALGLFYSMFGASLFEKPFRFLQSFTEAERNLLKQALEKELNCPLTSSVGRLFDAVSALLGLCYESTYEAKAAMLLEFCAEGDDPAFYRFKRDGQAPSIIDWEPMIDDILLDMENNVPYPEIAVKFHNTLVEVIIETAKISGLKSIILSGGCFQNVVLLKKTYSRLSEEGLTVYSNQKIPINDGGIAFGQIAVLYQ